jgi:hypothetical protein
METGVADEQSLRPFVCPSLWRVVECAARIDFCRSFVANRRYSDGRQLISAWGGVAGQDPGQGKQTTTVSAESQCFFFFFFSFFYIEILAKFNPKKERAKLVEFTLEKKYKIFENVPNFFVEN